jgi:hypothetical protein
LDEGRVERLSLVLRVVTLRVLRSNVKGLRREDLEAFALEPTDDLADETAFHAVGLHEDEGPLEAAFRHRPLEPLGGVRLSPPAEAV